MTKRERISAVLLGLGFIICLGTVGDMEFHNVQTVMHTVRGFAGLLLMAVAAPVSGDFPRKGGDKDV